ncbi:alkaline phosphatase [Acidaminobacter hydrogenoformans]|uniref:Alkaline phosphatase n=1 Tax=Acidaminobacter hydrogenoformans DSM 2784 TaxID=1120920 RepID=A0A1G5S8R0_9FIRM|nr:alkaline phosphatase [Acidaminobacter hydrogenoformans]SCZ81999.1 alkaline phosphatase [Acidaminobacter hydrogenoformans DSM 2784]
MVSGKFKKTATSVLLMGAMVMGLVVPAAAAPVVEDKLTGSGKDVKNVIVLISDGWGYNQILATDYYNDGKAGTQRYEKFPTKLAMSTYSVGSYDPDVIWSSFDAVKSDATDSAAAGTAMSTGSKTYDAAIGVDLDEQDLVHIATDFEALGRATGVVSSVQFSHATPASFVAHNVSRNNYSALANEMLMDSATDVIIGAGHPYYDNDGNFNSNPNFRYVGGEATWKALLNGTLKVADADGDGTPDPWALIQLKTDFEAMQTGETPNRLVGIPQVYTTLQQSRSGDGQAAVFEVDFNENVPTLEVMTNVALNVLDNDDDGFFLMVEGGAIDWAGHANQSGRLIEEQTDFNNAVNAVCDWVQTNSSWSETLVIVTGDHETGYLTGTEGVYDEVVNQGAGVMPIMTWNSGSHTNQLIPFFAKGAGSELFKKLADQQDPVRGAYLDNTELFVAIRSLIQ